MDRSGVGCSHPQNHAKDPLGSMKQKGEFLSRGQIPALQLFPLENLVDGTVDPLWITVFGPF